MKLCISYSAKKFQKLHYHGLLGYDKANSLWSGLNPCTHEKCTLFLVVVVVLECRGINWWILFSIEGLPSEEKALLRDISQPSRTGFLQSNGKGPVKNWKESDVDSMLGNSNSSSGSTNIVLIYLHITNWFRCLLFGYVPMHMSLVNTGKGKGEKKNPLSSPFPLKVFSRALYIL